MSLASISCSVGYDVPDTRTDYGLKADRLISESVPTNTKRAVIGDVRYFTEWAKRAAPDKEILPPSEDLIFQFILHHLKEGEMPAYVEESLLKDKVKRTPGLHSLATVERRLKSLKMLCSHNGVDDFYTTKVKKLLTAIRKKHTPPKKRQAIVLSILDQMLDTCGGTKLIDVRDRALLLFGWASGGRRRSEIVDATIENLIELSDGSFIYRIQRSKTDQKGLGHDVPVYGRAADALQAWIEKSGVTSGAIFRAISKGGKVGDAISEEDVNRIVKSRVKKSGGDEKSFTAHSLRSGFVTEGGKEGVPIGDTMALTGHRSISTAMGYYQAGNLKNNKAARLAG